MYCNALMCRIFNFMFPELLTHNEDDLALFCSINLIRNIYVYLFTYCTHLLIGKKYHTGIKILLETFIKNCGWRHAVVLSIPKPAIWCIKFCSSFFIPYRVTQKSVYNRMMVCDMMPHIWYHPDLFALFSIHSKIMQNILYWQKYFVLKCVPLPKCVDHGKDIARVCRIFTLHFVVTLVSLCYCWVSFIMVRILCWLSVITVFKECIIWLMKMDNISL